MPMPKQGDEIVVLVDGLKIKGRVVGEQGGMILINDGKMTAFVNKAKLGAILMENTSETAVPEKPPQENATDHFIVLMCANPKVNCPGVCYIKHGQGASQNDFEGFMAKCKKRQPNCMRRSIGKLTSAPMAMLKNILDNTVFGEYPDA
jgi:hypothetical protein